MYQRIGEPRGSRHVIRHADGVRYWTIDGVWGDASDAMIYNAGRRKIDGLSPLEWDLAYLRGQLPQAAEPIVPEPCEAVRL